MSNVFKILCSIVLVTVVACITTDNYDADTGEYTGSVTTLGEGGGVISTTDADGVVTPGPVIEAGKAVSSTLPPPVGTIVSIAVGLIPFLASKRSRKQLFVKPAQKLKSGDLGGAVVSVLAGVGLDHSEPDPIKAYKDLQLKGVNDGWVDPATGRLYEDIGKDASGPG